MYNPVAEIHLGRLTRNLQKIRDQLGDALIMPVVKANAYGHSAVHIARKLQDEGIRYLAVFTMGEALELRQNGITLPILLFSRLTSDMLEPAVENNLTVNIAWPDDIDVISEFIAKKGRGPKVHLKIDTGMSRLGVAFDEATDILERLAKTSQIELEGIYSHFATADEGDLTYAQLQTSRFNEIVDLAKKMHLDVKYFHMANSGAVLNLPESFFNLVRVGMLLYGAYPSDETSENIKVEPVMNFKGPIVTVRKVSAGTPVSYGSVYVPDEDCNIGVIQTGFADGLPRNWYENGYVGYKGEQFSIAGRICMDQMMVNFGDVVPKVGEEVLFFGDDGENHIRIEDIALEVNLTSYVLMTAIGGRTKREFVED